MAYTGDTIEGRILNDLLDRYERSKAFREKGAETGDKATITGNRVEASVKFVEPAARPEYPLETRPENESIVRPKNVAAESVSCEKAAKKKPPVRRVQLRVDSDPSLRSLMENTDERKEFLRAADALRSRGLIDYEWVRYEKGNLIDRIWLITTPEALRESYKTAGRIGKETQLETLEQQITEILRFIKTQCGCRKTDITEEGLSASGDDHVDSWLMDHDEQLTNRAGELTGEPSDIETFLEEMLAAVRSKRSIPRFFFHGENNKHSVTGAEKKNKNLLQFLAVIAGNQDEQLERIISTRLYGDSKYFERELRSRVISILRYIASKTEDGIQTDGTNTPDTNDHTSGSGYNLSGMDTDYESANQLLEERGIMKWPEILEFCGEIRVQMDDGHWIDYADHIYGAYVNSETVRHIQTVDLGETTSILSIENKANYTWYISSHRKERELVLYHGGCFSPTKGRWMKLIAERVHPESGIWFRHWSDIDLGGFRIFHRLKKEVFPSASPERMDAATLAQYRDKCIHIDRERYIELLESMSHNPEYEVFWEALKYMIENRVRLEQEAEI